MESDIRIEAITEKIYQTRGRKAILDRDLADLYGVETRILKQAVRRNIKRFPEDFMFELSKEEEVSLRSQPVILKGRGQHSKYRSFAFTEQGVAMLSSVLNSERAIEVNMAIMRTFVQMRQMLSSHAELKQKLEMMESKYDQDFGKGFDKSNLWNMRAFYLAYPILDVSRRELSRTHYRNLLRVEKPESSCIFQQLLAPPEREKIKTI